MMDSERGERFCILREIFWKIIRPVIGDFHLDFGCGDGWWTFYGAQTCSDKNILGYDVNTNKIEFANKKFKLKNLAFLGSKSEVNNFSPYGSIGSNFVFHEVPDFFGEISPLLKSQKKIYVLDYNLKNKSQSEFEKLFSTKRELSLVKKMGLDRVYSAHTKTGLDNCVSQAKQANFDTIKTYDFLNKYFIWIGEKR